MNFNPLKLKEGEKVRLDKGFYNSSVLTLFKLTPHEMIAIVGIEESKAWEVLTSRLSRVEEDNTPQ